MIAIWIQCMLLCLYLDCDLSWLAVQNILVDRHCQCRDIFLCSHRGDTGYGVLISDFGSAQRVDRVRQKLNQLEACHRPIKYSVYGTPGYRPPEVGERGLA